MKARLLLLFMATFNQFIYAQNTGSGRFSVRIHDEKQNAVEGATVFLMNGRDSSLVKMSISEKDGTASFEQAKAGKYWLMVSAVGYDKISSPAFEVGQSTQQVNLPDMQLEHATQQLKGISIQGTKPFIERELDRVVVNVNSSIVSAGSSALDVLSRSPGVLVNQNDDISMKGKQGVIVMIDGKPTYLSSTDLANLLRSTPANAIDKIELITNPPAKYEAAGSAGIINIKLKKDLRYGTNGSLSVSAGEGVYGKFNTGISINYRNNKTNVFANYNYTYRENFNNLVLDRKFFKDNGNLDGGYQQDNYLRIPINSNLAKAGLDYSTSKNTTIGILFTGLLTDIDPAGNNFSKVLDSLDRNISYFKTKSAGINHFNNYSGNINLKHVIDTAGQEITIDIDHARYASSTVQNYTTAYFNLDGTNSQPDDILYDRQPRSLNIYSVKADYALSFSKRSKLETGFKSSLVKADNNLSFYNIINGAAVFDTTKSNHFIYEENINAAYSNFNTSFDHYKLQLGLRAEQTVSNGNQLTTDNKFRNNYIQFFPTTFISDKIDERNEISLSIGRRIDRPTYKQLNPFKFYLDPSTFVEGNPYLRPQLTYTSEFSYTYKQKYSLTFTYSNTSNNITSILIPDETDNRITIQTDKNLTKVYYYAVSLIIPVDIAPWWTTTNNLNTYYNNYSGNLANTPLNKGRLAFDVSSNNSFKIAKNTTAELDGIFTSGNVYGYLFVDHALELSGGIQHTILKGKGTVKFNVSDFLRTNNLIGTTVIDNYSEMFVRHIESRVATLAFIYRFGNNKTAPSHSRTGGAEEEKKRAS